MGGHRRRQGGDVAVLGQRTRSVAIQVGVIFLAGVGGLSPQFEGGFRFYLKWDAVALCLYENNHKQQGTDFVGKQHKA